MAIELGSKVRCRITGFTGIAIGETRWLTGCLRYTVRPQGLDKDGKVKETASFDEPELEVLETPKKTKVAAQTLSATSPGGPRPEPQRRQDASR